MKDSLQQNYKLAKIMFCFPSIGVSAIYSIHRTGTYIQNERIKNKVS